MIKISNLNKFFYKNKSNQIHVINNSTIEFPETGLVTLFGESGCGKTTLLNVLGGLDDFESGTISIDNVEIKKYKASKIDRIRNEKIGYIFQNYLLLQQRTVYDNLKIMLNMYKISNKEKNERIDYVLNAVGMLKYKKKNVSQLSGGQQQRIAIARALIKAPSLILADEPTGNLDEKNTLEIMNILKKISKKTLVILVSHEQSIVKSFSDYVIEIKDGKVASQKELTNNALYELESDQNLYLKEFKYHEINNDQVSINYYSNDEIKVNLKIVFQNGKFYIESSDNVVLLDGYSEIKMVDDFKKVIDADKEIDKSNFELQRLEFVKTPKLPFIEQVRLAKENLRNLRKRTLVLSLPLFIIVVLVLLSVQSIVSASEVDIQHIAKTDSHIYNISLEKGDVNVTEDFAEASYEVFFDEFVKSNPNIEPFINVNPTIVYTIDSFTQIYSEKYEIGGFSLMQLDFLNSDDIIYGRMPKTTREIVIDRWVLENALEDSTLNNFMNVTSFINQKVTFKGINYAFTIVGICNSNENSVYINKWNLIDLIPSGIKAEHISICSLSELGKYMDISNIKLERNQCLWTHTKSFPTGYGKIILNNDNNLVYDILQQINFMSCPFDLVVHDDEYYDIIKSVLKNEWEVFDVYCENEEEVKQVESFIESVKDKYANGTLDVKYKESTSKIRILLFGKSVYNETLEPHIAQANKLVSSRIIVTATILLISICIVFFSMKSYALANIYDIGVYRAIGINKGSIVVIYALEILIISLKTTLVGGLLCYLITNIIASLPMVRFSMIVSLPLFLVGTIVLILLNIVVGIIPVTNYMRLTPSKILTKYDA